MKLKTFQKLFYIVLLFSNVEAFAQDDNPILSMDVTSVSIRNNFSQDSLPMITDSTVYLVGMNISLYDSTNIQNIEVKLGSTDGGSDLLSHTFAFDITGQLGNGLSYSRVGYAISLGLGELTGIDSYFAEVRVQHTDGSYSPSISFNRQ